ncbi:hypothetical protein K435DRAFT_834125 [Dendrothele bispora CBS 962.96]|uniref:Uncharacterized protein n=1 Tax=Dendrothele bispora (strain CBS 962.96) TaxID=1314807 RepID=A0A4S8MU31_DENBC|nr:hypothetical protein K435DRAFT_834125 [Dendrothele bispora CBS 962.96]
MYMVMITIASTCVYTTAVIPYSARVSRWFKIRILIAFRRLSLLSTTKYIHPIVIRHHRAHGVVGYHIRLALKLLRGVLGSIPNIWVTEPNLYYCHLRILFLETITRLRKIPEPRYRRFFNYKYDFIEWTSGAYTYVPNKFDFRDAFPRKGPKRSKNVFLPLGGIAVRIILRSEVDGRSRLKSENPKSRKKNNGGVFENVNVTELQEICT